MATTAVPIAASMVTPINPMMLPLIFYPLERPKCARFQPKKQKKGPCEYAPMACRHGLITKISQLRQCDSLKRCC